MLPNVETKIEFTASHHFLEKFFFIKYIISMILILLDTFLTPLQSHSPMHLCQCKRLLKLQAKRPDTTINLSQRCHCSELTNHWCPTEAGTKSLSKGLIYLKCISHGTCSSSSSSKSTLVCYNNNNYM